MKRKFCSNCDRPAKVCLCSHLRTVENKFSLTVFRHKSESSHALNTVKILQKTLSNIEVFDGEYFEESLAKPDTFLVYPGEASLPPDQITLNKNTNFLLLDGSWKKTRKIMYLNPWLENLPKVQLPLESSRYFLRKQKEQGFSSLEATVALFSRLENNFSKYEVLLNCLDRMMELQSSCIDKETLKKHFGERISKISSDKCDSMAESLSDHNSPDDTSQHPKTP